MFHSRGVVYWTHPNCIYWLLPVSHLLDSLIGPSELLLVVSHLLAFPVQFYVLGWRKVSNENLMWEIFWQGHILSVGGDALSTPSVGFGGIQFNWKTQWAIRFGCIRSTFVASCHYFHTSGCLWPSNTVQGLNIFFSGLHLNPSRHQAGRTFHPSP